jgi:hypothetical protein
MCRKILESWNASPAELQRFAGQLEALDRTRETLRETWLNDDLLERSRIVIEDEFSDPLHNHSMKPGWRCLFSVRIMRAQALNVCTSVYRRMAEAADLDPRARYLDSQRIDREMRGHPNPVVQAYLGFVTNGSRIYTVPGQQEDEVKVLTQRSLLRIAIGLAWYEAENGKPAGTLEALLPKYLPKIPTCVFSGQPFHYAPGRVWSVGQNGVDDGGVSPEPDDGASNGGDKDMVWRVKRK